MERSRIILSFAVVLVLILVFGGVYFSMYFIAPRVKQQRFKAAQAAAAEAHRKPDARDEAIASFRDVVAYAPSSETAASAQITLAYDLISRNEGLDRIEGFQLLRSVSADQTVSQRRRTAALVELAFNLWKIGSEPNAEFAKTYIFNEEPFATYLRDAAGDVYWATSKLFQVADENYPTAQAKIMVAFMHTQRLLSNRVAPGMTAKEAADWAQQLLRDGLPLLESPTFSYEGGRRAFLYLQYAKALDWSDITLKNVSVDDIKAAYERSIETAGSAPDDVHSQVALLEAKYYYAIFLANRFGANEIKAVDALLEPVTTAKGPQFAFFHMYIRNVYGRSPDTYVRSQLVKIAGISPSFRSYLIENGWQF